MNGEKHESLKLRLDHAWGHLTRAEMRMASGNFTLAMADLNKALKLDPSFTEALLTRGYLRYLQKDASGALRDMKEANRSASEKSNLLSYLDRLQMRIPQKELDLN